MSRLQELREACEDPDMQRFLNTFGPSTVSKLLAVAEVAAEGYEGMTQWDVCAKDLDLDEPPCGECLSCREFAALDALERDE